MANSQHTLGILCGGGPAPGINSVISAATIEAINRGWKVLGIKDGFKHLTHASTEGVFELTIDKVSRIHLEGGSNLSLSRDSLTQRDEGAADPDWRMNNALATLEGLGIDGLLTIGGDGTAYAATKLAERGAGKLKIAHVPKTIDNDLPLPGGAPTFGFSTARHVGTEIINNLMRDAMTTKRWFIVVAMGRSAGHLALGITKAAGATLGIIAEEFDPDRKISLNHLVDIIETSLLKRLALGRPFGVVLLSEGLCMRISPEELEKADPDLERDSRGNLRISDIPLHRILTLQLRKRLRKRDLPVRFVPKRIGYELRCAPPVPFDIEYTRDLGHGAVKYLHQLFLSGSNDIGAMIARHEGNLTPLPLGSFLDPATGFTKVRQVDVTTESYEVAVNYMIRLKRSDFDDAELLGEMSAKIGMTPEQFQARFGYLVDVPAERAGDVDRCKVPRLTALDPEN